MNYEAVKKGRELWSNLIIPIGEFNPSLPLAYMSHDIIVAGDARACSRCLSPPSRACTSSPALSKSVSSGILHPATCSLGACWSPRSLNSTRLSCCHWNAKIETGRVAQPDWLLRLTHGALRLTHTQSAATASIHRVRPAAQLAPNIEAINGAPKEIEAVPVAPDMEYQSPRPIRPSYQRDAWRSTAS